MRYWTECLRFYRQFREQYNTTGSILPSSRALGRALTRPMRRAAGPRRILEVGPGTGAVTREIVRGLRPDDRFDIVEINGAFVAHLEERFAAELDFRRHRAQCRVLHAPLQQVPGAACYDFIVSGLPLNNFSLGLVEDIFASYQRLLEPHGTLSYFEYLAIRALKMPFVAPQERDRLERLTVYLEEKIRRYQIGSEEVYCNMPPAVARHFRFGSVVVC
jgi:phosphatidylethanolamine/phosphatidyl-N-methylethanolamine N-methyltransferase